MEFTKQKGDIWNLMLNDGAENKQKEIWKDIKNYEGLYQISNLGRVKTLQRRMKNRTVPEKIRKPDVMKGYHCVTLMKDGKPKVFRIHRLVAEAFIGERPGNKYQIDHIDGNKSNNRVENLEWVLPKENTRRAIQNGQRVFTEERKEKLRRNMIKRWKSPTYRLKQSAMSKAMWADPEHKELHSKAISDGWRRKAERGNGK